MRTDSAENLTANSTSKGARAAKEAKASSSRIVAEGDGVNVLDAEHSYIVVFRYNPALISEIRKIPEAKFDHAVNGWMVSKTHSEALAITVESMRKEARADLEALTEIKASAHKFALELHAARGVPEGIEPMIWDYHQPGETITGEIVAANSRYVAQFTGQGSQDGVAFIVLHRTSELNQQLFKGDKAAITYDDKFRGKAKPYLTREERLEQFEKHLGASLDGVRVTEADGKYLVEFDYNPALMARIQRIDGAAFDKEAKAWTVETDKKEFLARAVHDMREEMAADRADRSQLESVANSKIDGAVIKDAFTRDGTSTTGKILGKSDRYVLQHTGEEYAALHRVGAFETIPDVGQTVRIEYQGGKASISDRTHAKGRGTER